MNEPEPLLLFVPLYWQTAWPQPVYCSECRKLCRYGDWQGGYELALCMDCARKVPEAECGV